MHSKNKLNKKRNIHTHIHRKNDMLYASHYAMKQKIKEMKKRIHEKNKFNVRLFQLIG